MSTGPMAAGVHRFTGKPEDGATEFYYFGARYYDPEVGRFISRDPAKDGLNWYAYVSMNPIARVDHDGLREAMGADLGEERELGQQERLASQATAAFVNAALDMAESGVRYVYGAGHPGTLWNTVVSLIPWLRGGVDCTGLVIVAGRRAGIPIPGSLSTASIADSPFFIRVTGDYRPGDIAILDWDGDGKPNHAAIHVGDNRWLWASSAKEVGKVICVDSKNPGEYLANWQATEAALSNPARSAHYRLSFEYIYCLRP